MNVVSSSFALLGAFVALFAGIGLLTSNTPYARFYAAGEASPIAFLLVAIGAGIGADATGDDGGDTTRAADTCSDRKEPWATGVFEYL